MHEVQVNSKYAFQINKDKKGLRLEDIPVQWDKITVKDSHFSILWNHVHYEAELIRFDRKAKSLEIKVNGNVYSITIRDQFDQLLEKLGMDMAAGAKINEVKAPMPGMVLNVKVETGQEVAKDDALMVLEAMKMENVIKAPGEGKVKKVHVKAGDAVEKNAVLIEFE
jgi:biotin carboxyl carrier protein